MRSSAAGGPRFGSSAETTATPWAEEPPVAAVDIEGAERRAVVRAAIDRLGPKHRPVVVLRMLDGLSTKETAEVLELPLGTVLSRLARAMAELATALRPYIQDSGIREQGGGSDES